MAPQSQQPHGRRALLTPRGGRAQEDSLPRLSGSETLDCGQTQGPSEFTRPHLSLYQESAERGHASSKGTQQGSTGAPGAGWTPTLTAQCPPAGPPPWPAHSGGYLLQEPPSTGCLAASNHAALSANSALPCHPPSSQIPLILQNPPQIQWTSSRKHSHRSTLGAPSQRWGRPSLHHGRAPGGMTRVYRVGPCGLDSEPPRIQSWVLSRPQETLGAQRQNGGLETGEVQEPLA